MGSLHVVTRAKAMFLVPLYDIKELLIYHMQPNILSSSSLVLGFRGSTLRSGYPGVMIEDQAHLRLASTAGTDDLNRQISSKGVLSKCPFVRIKSLPELSWRIAEVCM